MSEVYKRLFFYQQDGDQKQKLEEFAEHGWFLVGCEPIPGGCYFWLREMPKRGSASRERI